MQVFKNVPLPAAYGLFRSGTNPAPSARPERQTRSKRRTMTRSSSCWSPDCSGRSERSKGQGIGSQGRSRPTRIWEILGDGGSSLRWSTGKRYDRFFFPFLFLLWSGKALTLLDFFGFLGVQERRKNVIDLCTAASPKHSPVWQSIAKDLRNQSKSTEEILKLVAVALE